MAKPIEIKVKIEGIEEMKKHIETVVRPGVEKAAMASMEKGAAEVVETMKRLVPRGTAPLKDRTMRVWQSIAWTWGAAPEGAMVLGKSAKVGGAGRKFITIYAGGPGTMVGKRKQFNLARLVEFGTLNAAGEEAMAAQPYFFPAWRIGKRGVRARIARDMRTALKKGFA